MGSKTKELIETLTELCELYNKHDYEHWETWLSESKTLLENSDFRGVTYLLSAFGGMGSINDNFFAKSVWWSRYLKPEKKDNEKLDYLLSKAYNLATDIKREVDIAPNKSLNNRLLKQAGRYYRSAR